MDGGRAGRPAGPGRGPGQGADPCPADRIVPGQPGSVGAISGPGATPAPGNGPSATGLPGPVKAHLPGGRRPPSLSTAPNVPRRPVQTTRQDCGDRSPKTEEVRYEELDDTEHHAGHCLCGSDGRGCAPGNS